jgi:hypothetical protein
MVKHLKALRNARWVKAFTREASRNGHVVHANLLAHSSRRWHRSDLQNINSRLHFDSPFEERSLRLVVPIPRGSVQHGSETRQKILQPPHNLEFLRQGNDIKVKEAQLSLATKLGGISIPATDGVGVIYFPKQSLIPFTVNLLVAYSEKRPTPELNAPTPGWLFVASSLTLNCLA